MPPVWLAYRLQVFQPRSVAPGDESALLTPIPGASHSDNFDVATIQGVAGVQPYLFLPDGQNGSIDPVSKNTTVGTRVLDILDQSVGSSGSNAIRWAVAFLGDATRRNRLKGLKAILFEQTVEGGAWNPLFTGRIGNVSTKGLLRFSLEVKSSSDDLRRKVFVYDPLPSASYAFRSALFPPRLPKAWGSGTIPAQPWLNGHTASKFTATGSDGITRARITLDGGQNLQALTLVTRQSLAFASGAAPALAIVNNGSAIGAFRIEANQSHIGHFTAPNEIYRNYFDEDFSWLTELPSTHPLYMALPANGTAVTFYIAGVDTSPVSKTSPLFIDDVHPLQLWADILDGKFSIPNAANAPSPFSARPIAPRDTTALGPWDYTNPASPSFSMSDLPNVRFIITEPQRANEFIQKNILQPFNLAYRTDGQGRVVPLDHRVTASTTVSGAIVDDDLVELPKDWSVDGSSALFGVDLTYYVDRGRAFSDLMASTDTWPDIAAALVDSVQEHVIVVNPNAQLARDAGDTITSIDAQGIRLTENEFKVSDPDQLLAIDKLAKAKVAMYDLLAPFAGGSVIIPVSLTRGSAFAASGRPGQFWTITASCLPDPATNQRGGPRVGLCLSRTERGLRILTTFLDVGSATPATAPLIGTLAVTNGGLDVPITLNAAGDPVQVEYNSTPAGTGSRPIATDPGWTLIGGAVTTSTGARLQGVPANRRLWVRARSKPSGSGLQLPSAYVFPAAGAPAGSIDVAAITAPSALATSGLLANRVDLSWTVGDATMSTEIYLTTGGVPGAWTLGMKRFPVLPPGSTKFRLTDLTLATAYTAAVRHRDRYGGTSAFATVSFTTTSTAGTAPTPPSIGPTGKGSGGYGGSGTTTPPRRFVPTGVMLALAPADPAYEFELQEAPDSAGAPNVGAAVSIASNVPGMQELYTRELPLDGAQRWYRLRHVGAGDTASAWTAWQPATPTILAPQGLSDLMRIQAGDLNANRLAQAPRSARIEGQGRNWVQTLTYEIPNAEFDIWESASQPHAWTVDTGDSSSCAQDQVNVFSGDASAKFSFGAGGSAGTFRGLTTNDLTKGAFCIPLHPGTRYRFKFASRVSSIANAPSYRVTLTHDVGGTLITQSTFVYRAAAKWQIDLLTFTVPLGAGPLTRLAIEYSRNATTATDFWQDGTRLQDIGTQRTVILTTGTSWTVPSDFNPANNTVELWGGGGGGAPGTTNANGGGGGGGGGYRYQKNFDPAGATTVAYAIGGGGGASSAGGDSTWNSAAVTAKAGNGASAATSGAGGAAGSGGTGGIAGGNGGTGRSGTGNSGGGGGGGAAGSTGANNGAAGTNIAAGAGGQGGTGVQSNASAVGGTGGVATGGAGGNASQLTSTDDATTAGAGGGGGGAFNPTSGGNGGQYGAGGGGGGATAAAAGSGSSGKQGCIVISWITAA